MITDITLTQISGSTYRVRVTARNQSSTPVTFGNNFHVNVYLDGNTSSAIIIWGVQASWFGAGQSRVLEQNYTFSSGPHTLRAWADPWNVVVESNETNNTRDTTLTAPAVTEGVEPRVEPAAPVEPQPTPTNTP